MGRKHKRRSKRVKPLNIQHKQTRRQSVEPQSVDGGSTTYYVHGPRGIHAQQESEWKWMVQDGLGGVRGVVDDNLAVQQSRAYDPYGSPTDVAGPEQTMYGYTGEPTDDNELVYLRERYYNPNMGTFISEDPTEGSMDTPMSLNRYAYVQGNPVNMTDPSGRVPVNQSIYNMMSSDPLGFARMMNAGVCLGLQDPCFGLAGAAYLECRRRQARTPTPTGTPPPTATPNPCAATPTPGKTPSPTITPVIFNTARIQSLTDDELELIALNIYYEARDFPEHWQAIANVWFNRLGDPYATTINVQRLLADNSAGWSGFVGSFYRAGRGGTRIFLDPLNLSSTDIAIMKDSFRGYSDSDVRSHVNAARTGYPDPQYVGMLAFFHANVGEAGQRVCEMECVAAAPGPAVAANLARRGPLRIETVPGSRTLIMNNGIFWPSANVDVSSFCATCCRGNASP